MDQIRNCLTLRAHRSQLLKQILKQEMTLLQEKHITI